MRRNAIALQAVVVNAAEVGVFLLGAFSGFIRGVAPPEEAGAGLAMAIGSSLSLIALLLAKAFSKIAFEKSRRRTVWLSVAVAFFALAILSTLSYIYNINRLTFSYPPESAASEYVCGTELTPLAATYRYMTGKSNSALVAAFGGLTNREQVWTGDSIRTAKLVLTGNYVALILSLAAAIFGLTESIATEDMFQFAGRQSPLPDQNRHQRSLKGIQCSADGPRHAPNEDVSKRTAGPETEARSRAATHHRPFSVFICYAASDNEGDDRSRKWLDRLVEELEPLRFQKQLSIWSDRDLEAGNLWEEKIKANLEDASAAVLLISPAFLASKYIRNSELPVLLEKAQGDGLAILPIILRHSLHDQTRLRYPDPEHGPEELQLSSFQAVNSPDKPLNSLLEAEQDKILRSVGLRLLELAAEREGGSAATGDEGHLGARKRYITILGIAIVAIATAAAVVAYKSGMGAGLASTVFRHRSRTPLTVPNPTESTPSPTPTQGSNSRNSHRAERGIEGGTPPPVVPRPSLKTSAKSWHEDNGEPVTNVVEQGKPECQGEVCWQEVTVTKRDATGNNKDWLEEFKWDGKHWTFVRVLHAPE